MKLTTIDRTVIGSKSEILEFEVEKGAIRAFATALDQKTLYTLMKNMQRQGYASLVAPPTFPSTLDSKTRLIMLN